MSAPSEDTTRRAKEAIERELVNAGVYLLDGIKRDALAWACADAALRTRSAPSQQEAGE